MGRVNGWGMSLHIPALISLQVIFIILFGLFSRYDPATGMRNQYENQHGTGSKIHAHRIISNVYPMFQDVHVMIFIGFGFLMTFLKRYGLGAVSLNMLCAVLAIEWSILVHGFLHFHYDKCPEDGTDTLPHPVETSHDISRRSASEEVEAMFNRNCYPNWPWINISLTTMLSADFATAAVLISFGVLLGTTSPIQLVLMTLIEIVLFNVNEVIGRSYFGAVDAGDTIFVHMFGAYYGLAISRVLYHEAATTSKKASANRTSDLFSMVGTIFLWLFWPSFNSGAAAEGDAQMRALINTYLSLCACCMSAFAISALVNPHKKFCMEHIQNATLAGGVAVGAVADMMVTPFGSIVIGSLAGVLSTLGYQYVSPYLSSRWKITDTCGVNNLHGMPSIFGGILSILLAGLSSRNIYDQFNESKEAKLSSLHEIFPGADGVDWSPAVQAGNQAAAMVVTLLFAVVGGLLTGMLMKWVGKLWKRGSTLAVLIKSTITLGNVMAFDDTSAMPRELMFDDDAFFDQSDDEDEAALKVV